ATAEGGGGDGGGSDGGSGSGAQPGAAAPSRVNTIAEVWRKRPSTAAELSRTAPAVEKLAIRARTREGVGRLPVQGSVEPAAGAPGHAAAEHLGALDHAAEVQVVLAALVDPSQVVEDPRQDLHLGGGLEQPRRRVAVLPGGPGVEGAQIVARERAAGEGID